jgi:transketolase
MCLSRQKVPGVRDRRAANLSAKGAYELLAAEGGERP